jgi:hypothetical protein
MPEFATGVVCPGDAAPVPSDFVHDSSRLRGFVTVSRTAGEKVTARSIFRAVFLSLGAVARGNRFD